MAILSIDEAGISRSGNLSSDWKRTFERSWDVLVSTAAHGASYILSNAPVSLGQVYSANSGTEVDSGAYVQSLSAECVSDDYLTWRLRATYGPYDATIQSRNPVERPPEVSIVANQFEQIVDFDKDGAAVVNSAGDPFVPGLTEEDSRPIVQIVRWQTEFSMYYSMLYRNAINSDEFFGAAPRTVRSYPIVGERVRDPDYGWLWRVSYQFAYNPDGWRRKVADAGLREKYSSGTKIKPILKLGVPVTEPQFLDGSGAALAVGGTIRALEFALRPELPFSVFGFTEADFEGITW